MSISIFPKAPISFQMGEPSTDYVAIRHANERGSGSTNTALPIKHAGTISNLYCYVASNNISSTTLTLRISGSDSTLTLTIGSSATGAFWDNTHTPSVAATDVLDYKVVTSATGGTRFISITNFSIEFTPTDTSVCVMLCASRNIDISETTNRYHPPGDGESTPAGTTSEDRTKLRIRSACVARNLWTRCTFNSRSVDSTLGTRKNGAAGSQTQTIGAGATGVFEDTSNTDTLAVGDDFNYYVVTSAGTGSVAFEAVSCFLVSTNSEFILSVFRCPSGANLTATDMYIPVGGSERVSEPAANIQTQPKFTFTAKELALYLSGNSQGSTTNMYLYDNGADSGVTVAIGAGATGLFNDATHTTEITGGTDSVCFHYAGTGGGGTLTLQNLSIVGSTTAPPPPVVKPFMLMGVGP